MGWAKTQYIEALHAKARERAEVRMVVNTGSLLVQRCRQAQKVHGHDPASGSQDEPGRMGKEMQATVLDRFGKRARGSGVGSSNDGHDAATRSGEKKDIGAEGHCQNDAAIMRQIRKGWQAFGVDDPWWVVHDKPVPQLARYNSEPLLTSCNASA